MTSVDTNIIFSLLNRRDRNHQLARRAMEEMAQRDVMVIAPIVYAELMASSDREAILRFLDRAGINVLWELPREVWNQAGIAFGRYATERQQGHLPRRLIADFVIAAHAEYHSLSVLTFDTTVYHAVYQQLDVIEPR